MSNAPRSNLRTEPYLTDRLLDKIILPLIPRWVQPNHITILRFMAAPLVFWLIWQEYYGWGLLAFLFTALTDAIDGAMARLRQQITAWGITYDPVADKILVGGVVLILVLQKLGFFLTFFIIVFELITLLGGFCFKKRGVLSPASVWGKTKMILQVAGISVLLIGVIWNIPLLYSFSYGIFLLSLCFAFMNLIFRGQ